MDLAIHPVTEPRFADLAALFESPGGPSYCWCMAWRARKDERSDLKGAELNALHKRQLHARLQSGEPIGLLAYDGARPVGWCSCGPMASFARFGKPAQGVDPTRTWAISCFFIQRACRGQGIATALTRAAIAEARRAGATLIRATPVDAEAPSYRQMGRVEMFAALGFTDHGLSGLRRHVMDLPL